MTRADEVWLPLVDEPLGTIVARLEAEDATLRDLVRSPRRRLAFRTFAYIRVGLLLGQMLVESDIDPELDGETWVDALLRDPENHRRIAQEVRAVADEIAADPHYATDESEVDDETRARFREFAKQRLGR